MFFRNFKNLFIVLFVIIGFSSCKKDEDEQPPVISTQWSHGQVYDVLDFIRVRATITDNEKITSVNLYLHHKESGKIYLTPLSWQPNQSNLELDEYVELSDSLLPTGSYYFQLTASDGDNTAEKFLEFYVRGLARNYISTVVITDQGSQSQWSEILANNGNVQQIKKLSKRVKEIAVNSYDQQLWILPQNDKELQAYDLTDTELAFSETVVSAYNDPFQAINSNGRNSYIGDKEGRVYGFQENYIKTFTYTAQSNRYPVLLKADQQYLAVVEQDRSGSAHHFNLLFRISGASSFSFPLNFTAKGLVYPASQPHILIFGNQLEKLKVIQVDLETGLQKTLVDQKGPEILDVISAEGIVYLATGNGLYSYSIQSAILQDQQLTGINKLAFNAVDQLLYAAKDHEVLELELPALNQRRGFSFNNSILAIEERYNY